MHLQLAATACYRHCPPQTLGAGWGVGVGRGCTCTCKSSYVPSNAVGRPSLASSASHYVSLICLGVQGTLVSPALTGPPAENSQDGKEEEGTEAPSFC